MKVCTLIPTLALLATQVLADCGPGPAQNSFIACAASLDANTITGCIQDSPQQTSTPPGYNFAACSCTSLSLYSSCMEFYCPAQVTQDVLPAKDYYCALATGGTPTYAIAGGPTSTDIGAAGTAGSGDGPAQTSKSVGTTGKPGGAGMVEPAVGMGVGLVAILGVVGIWL